MQTITGSGGTLFQIACDYLGDATQWSRIAALNGILDPWLQGLWTLQIPAPGVVAGGSPGPQ